MMAKIRQFLKWIESLHLEDVIDSKENIFIFPLAVFLIIFLRNITNPLTWLIVIYWLIVFWRNYEKSNLA